MLLSGSLRFVKAGEEGEGVDALMHEALEAVREKGGEPVWVGAGDLEGGPERGCIYVLENFSSPEYKALVGKCRIVGPPAVLAHNKHGWPLPASIQPVFSMAMHGVVACFTHAGSKETRERLTQLVRLMGGRVEGDLTKRVTHLIAGQVGSNKYHVACELHLPILLPSWVEFSWDEGLTSLVSATDEAVMSKHLCLPFTGCTITVTGLDEGTRARVKEACQKNGGNYSGELTKGVCTHLIVGSKTSKLYLCGFTDPQLEKLILVVNRGGALRYSMLSDSVTHVVMGEKDVKVLDRVKQLDTDIHAVGPQWLLESCAKGERQPEEKYHISIAKEKSLDQSANTKKRVLPGNTSEPAPKRPRPHDDSIDDVDDIMRQYAAAPLPEDGEEEGVELQPLAPGVLEGRGTVCVSKLFSEADRETATKVVREHGGTIVTSASRASYLLAPLEGEGSHTREHTQGAVVTMIWLARCIEEKTLLDHASYFLFRPMGTPISNTTLTGCVLAFSQFSDLEREHLIRFSKRLGAIVQDHFVRYPSSDGLCSTSHLLLKKATGNKFTSAVKWGVPAVRDTWLFECALARQIVPVEPHLLTNKTPEHPYLHRVSCPPSDSSCQPSGTTSKGSSCQPSGTSTHAQNHVQNGHDAREESGVLEGVVVCFNKKLASPSRLRSTALGLGAKCSAKLDKTVTHYLCQGKSTELLRDREVKQAKEKGCQVVSPHWLLQCQEKGYRQLETDYPMTFNPSMALDVLMPLSQMLPKPDRPATPPRLSPPLTSNPDNEEEEEGDAPLSDPSEAMKQLHQHLEELREAPQEPTKRRRSRRLAKMEVTDPPAARIPPASPSTPGKGRVHHRGRRERERVQLLDSQVSDSQLLQVTYDDPDGRREKAKLLDRIKREEELLAQGIKPKGVESGAGLGSREEGGRLKLDLSPPDEENCPQAKGLAAGKSMVKAGVREKARPAPSGQSDTRRAGEIDTMNAPPIGVPIVTHSTRNPSEAQPLYDEWSRLTRTQKPKFLLSSLEQREKIDYGALIQELGGEYIDQDYFTTKCTHLIVGKASRTEKYLGACAAGKWVLHKAYLEECRAAKHFVLEEGHEWGENEVGNPLVAAPRRWRLELAKRREELGRRGGASVGAFVGWKVVVFAEKNKLPGLRRLLEAGGATVVTSHTPSALRGVTHAFITMSHFPKDAVSLEELVKAGVHCLRPDYIAEYLCKGQEVSMDLFLLNEVKPLMK